MSEKLNTFYLGLYSLKLPSMGESQILLQVNKKAAGIRQKPRAENDKALFLNI